MNAGIARTLRRSLPVLLLPALIACISTQRPYPAEWPSPVPPVSSSCPDLRGAYLSGFSESGPSSNLGYILFPPKTVGNRGFQGYDDATRFAIDMPEPDHLVVTASKVSTPGSRWDLFRGRDYECADGMLRWDGVRMELDLMWALHSYTMSLGKLPNGNLLVKREDHAVAGCCIPPIPWLGVSETQWFQFPPLP